MTPRHRGNTGTSGRTNRESKARLDLLYEVGKKVGSTSQMTRLLERITMMTQRTLKAEASSVLLSAEGDRKMVFEVAVGAAGKSLKQLKLNTATGIAGWVIRYGKPLVVHDVKKDLRFNEHIDKLTGFETKSIVCAPMIVQNKVIGVIEVLNKKDGSPFTEEDLETVVSVASTAAMAIENARLQQATVAAYKSTITVLASAIDAKDPYTRGHSQRVMEYSLMAGASISLDDEDLEALEYASILHDIGKISIDDDVLKKPGSLTPKEWDIIREHPVTGARMLKEIPFLKRASELVLHHHERYDGSGYPDGLRGEKIPMLARLISVADAFDTMTTDRSYRPALTVDYTVSELYGCSGTQFCPEAVKAFVSGLRLGGKNPALPRRSTPAQ